MKKETLRNGILNACQKIAPAWPLENSVAVNPYLGLSKMSFDEAAQILDARGGIQMYMPLEFYFEQIQKKEITRIDIEKALQKKRLNFSINDFLKIANKLKLKDRKAFKGVVISDLASQNSKTDYDEIKVEQV